MAKKKEALTLEQKLENAIIADGEQPYKIPDNWVWTTWGQCGEHIAGSGFKNEYQGFTEYEIPFYKVGSLKYSYTNGVIYDRSNTISDEIRIKLKAKIIPKNAILFAKIGEAIRLNRRSINNTKCCIDNNLMAFVPSSISYKYVYFWSLNTNLYDITNATTVPSIRKSDIETIKFPLPPLAEQQRIVVRIESLFDKLEKARLLVQSALDSFEHRKSAVLHQAFTGELTKKWREENNINFDSTMLCPLSQICDSFQYGTSSKSIKVGKIAVVRMGNLQNGAIDWNNLVYSDNEDDNIKYRLNIGDVLFNRTNSPILVGKTSIYRGEYPAIFAGYLIRLNYNKSIVNGYYLNYMLNTPQAKKYCSMIKTDGVNQSNINAKKIATFPIPVCTMSEQQEIVRILDSVFAQEEKAKELASVIDKIDLIKKSILAKAFRGELGTNNPDDENATELLKKILAEV